MDSMIVALFFALLEVAEQRLMTGRCCRSAKQKQEEGAGALEQMNRLLRSMKIWCLWKAPAICHGMHHTTTWLPLEEEQGATPPQLQKLWFLGQKIPDIVPYNKIAQLFLIEPQIILIFMLRNQMYACKQEYTTGRYSEKFNSKYLPIWLDRLRAPFLFS